MKILLVSANSSINGANKSMCILAENLIRYGCDVTIALRTRGDILHEIESRGLKYVILTNYPWTVPDSANKHNAKNIGKYFVNIFLKHSIKNYLRKQNFDIVHNNSISSFLVAECASEMKIKTVWHFREFLEEDHHETIYKLYNDSKIINRSDVGVAISKTIFDKYSQKYNLPLKLIYNGIQYTDFYCERKILENRTITLAVIGRVSKGKNQLEVVKALSNLQKKGLNNFVLHIIGDKKNNGYYEQILNYLEKDGIEIKKNVIFDGIVTDISTKYKEIDITIVPSVSEAFGRVAVEAMLSGCYVIGANTAGTAEILDDRFSTKYELGNVEDLANKLSMIDANRGVYQDRAMGGQKYAAETFSAEKNARSIFELYKEILENQ